MKKIAGVSALISGLLPLVVILALSFSTKDFLLFRDYISTLGVKEFAGFFNFTLIISGFLIIPFGFYIYKIIRKIYIAVLFVAVVVSLIGIGVFPMSIEPWHFAFSALFFFLVFVLILTMGLKTKLGYFSKTAIVIGVLGLVGDFVHLVLNFNPTVETLQVFMITIWLVYSGIDSLKGYFGEPEKKFRYEFKTK